MNRQYTHLVIIIREPGMETTVAGFYNRDDAERYAEDAGAQWSETYVTEVIKGPRV